MRRKDPLYKTEPAYNCWASMVARCCRKTCKAYPAYGGSGVKIFKGWKGNFRAFIEHIGPRPSNIHSIDRIDNSKGYFPGNVRWATPKEQSKNSAKPKVITAFGVSRNLAEWGEIVKISRFTLSARLIRGWPAETALTLKPFTGNRVCLK